jgi:hypothetical protein
MKPAKDQKDSSLYADGMSGEGYSRNSRSGSVQTNKWSGHANDGRLVNKGRGPTRGNQDMKPMNVGPAATKDGFRIAPDKVGVSGTERPTIKNMDSINVGSQVRTPGGTRAWDPKMGQNYNGNPDMIRIGQTGGPGYGTVSKGKNSQESVAKRDTFNYGPKSQY